MPDPNRDYQPYHPPVLLNESECATIGHAAAPPRSVMNSRRRMLAPKLRRRHLSGSNEHFDRGLKPASKPLPQCTANVAVGSLADKPSRAKINFCPLLSESGQTRARLNCPLSAKSGLMQRSIQHLYSITSSAFC
jgi:hypothetical protein